VNQAKVRKLIAAAGSLLDDVIDMGVSVVPLD
jgi:hypothetical protein